MSANEEVTDDMESPKQRASACAPGCDCHAAGPSGRMRLVLGIIVLLATATLVARAVIKGHGTSGEPDAAAFVLSTVAQTPPAESISATPPVEAAKTLHPFVGKEIAALSELNTMASASNAVFVYVPGKDGASSNLPTTAMKSAASRIESQGYKISLFTLDRGSADYETLAAQMSVPGVLAMVKGRGMSAVSGDITEPKLIQGFVAAGSAGGCGPAGCGPAGCD